MDRTGLLCRYLAGSHGYTNTISMISGCTGLAVPTFYLWRQTRLFAIRYIVQS